MLVNEPALGLFPDSLTIQRWGLFSNLAVLLIEVMAFYDKTIEIR
jgi:hypothetical protein